MRKHTWEEEISQMNGGKDKGDRRKETYKSADTKKGCVWRRAQGLAMEAKHMLQATNEKKEREQWHEPNKFDSYDSIRRMVLCVKKMKEVTERVQ